MTMSTHPPAGLPAESQPSDLCGRTLADFHILRKLGQGGMGQVYLAEQISLKRKVALKILRADTSAETKVKMLARFRREAEAVAQATHANIVQVYAYGEADGMPYMALEYVEGRNLREFIAKKGPPDLLVSLSIMRQIASALQRASELGLVHRDIKPENILLTRKGEVKVADFGLSCWMEGERAPELNLTATGVAMGTPLYMSPEQVEGKPVDPRTDIYSFGVTCYHMLTGQPPFRGVTAFEVAIQHVQKVADPLSKVRPDLPSLLCEIVHKMMAKAPAQRYQTCRDVLRDLGRVRGGLSGATGIIPPIPTGQVELIEPSARSAEANTAAFSTRPRTPSKAWMIAGIVGSLLLAAGVGMALARKDRRKGGPLPGTEKIPPADASIVEPIRLPSKREQALRLFVDQALNVPAGKSPDRSGFNVCMELGLFYLDEMRLADAEKHFDRLAACKEPLSFRQLGLTGKAIALALRNESRLSNDLFDAVFAPSGFPKLAFLKGGNPRPSPGVVRLHQIEQGVFRPILPLLNSPRGRDWLGQARWYNFKNGIAESAVPRYLVWSYPLADARAKK